MPDLQTALDGRRAGENGRGDGYGASGPFRVDFLEDIARCLEAFKGCRHAGIDRDLQEHFLCSYDEKGAIGRRYRRMDEVGTPFCVTVDGDSVADGTVTVRERDSMEQTRMPAEKVGGFVMEKMAAWTPGE